ncbi:hypothetical protein F2P81_006235 [Scophthalmus maximus]|uniref:Uncharacterized protein n=1 Tax=Scophthalmus maximus TaxID=52904 RepID=A0A6A4T2M8_SCOMX|nr:hypothetical protein F2P81_006235 [Scophthalmus maximus]
MLIGYVNALESSVIELELKPYSLHLFLSMCKNHRYDRIHTLSENSFRYIRLWKDDSFSKSIKTLSMQRSCLTSRLETSMPIDGAKRGNLTSNLRRDGISRQAEHIIPLDFSCCCQKPPAPCSSMGVERHRWQPAPDGKHALDCKYRCEGTKRFLSKENQIGRREVIERHF